MIPGKLFLKRLDAESLEILHPTTTKQIASNQKLSDEICLHISQNVISEAILDAILTNKAKLSEANNFEVKLQTNPDMTMSLLLKPKQETPFQKVMQAAKATQTVIDMKVKRDEKQISNISNILNSILKLKNIKKPLMKLPASSEVAKKMKYETKLKLCEQ